MAILTLNDLENPQDILYFYCHKPLTRCASENNSHQIIGEMLSSRKKADKIKRLIKQQECDWPKLQNICQCCMI